ncbi:MAG: polyribonucleotide nucleotidyltransferase [Bdellovibrionales bacterium]|jgi:polyribonucleotide nucleotidyltransferase|nr:polyribonucleotide nucleotidyltransferase [Bdellovibrionales bacterium]MBT3526226.1 polyribonucleotide nucleotidyltransferase [Bdellovibrionales bacterium]
MNENKKEYRIDFGGKELIIETGRLAKQADGSVLVSCEGTQVLVTVCSSREMKDGQDFFPLTVDYVEKFYAAGKFLGGFMKREAKPTAQETLNARLIDRPIRPLFPKGYMFDTIVAATAVSYNPEGGDPEVLAGIGASAALSVSDIPFAGPIATCKVGKIDSNLVLNPSLEMMATSTLEITVSASNDAILMVEGEADQLSEEDVLEAILFAHEEIKRVCGLISTMRDEVGKPKREFVTAAVNQQLLNKVTDNFSEAGRACLNITDKLERQRAVQSLEKSVAEALEQDRDSYSLSESDSCGKEAYKAVDELMYNMMRGDILNNEQRIAGRGMCEVRQIETEASILDAPHGSSLFTRGETQVMATVTIGGTKGEQMADRITGIFYDRFYLHYNFPPFSVGEARGKFNVSRRELGHGNLAQRALKAVFPEAEDFPYTTRVVCEVLESNGSSSMGSVCSASMAMMDAGVPLTSPVAGIAMGLVSDGDRYKILTDILGDEDHLGDMDFKVAGTQNGITAIQMDIKITGLTTDIIKEALIQAKDGRLHILDQMASTITTNRTTFKKGVPKIERFNIPEDKMGALIGPGGKNIKKLQENFDLTIEALEGGIVQVIGTDPDNIQACTDSINLQINGPKIGKDYQATVVTLKDFGAFADIVPGVSGLIHVSEITNSRVNDVNEYLAIGDLCMVRVLDVDKMGRIKLSAKAVKPLEKRDA